MVSPMERTTSAEPPYRGGERGEEGGEGGGRERGEEGGEGGGR